MNTLPTRVFPFMWHFCRRQPWAFAFIVFAATIWSLNEAVFPLLVKLIVNTLANLPSREAATFSALSTPLTLLIIIWVAMDVCMRAQGFTVLRAFPRFKADVRTAVYNYIQQHSHQFFANQFAGKIASKLNDLPTSGERILEIGIFVFLSVGVAFVLALVVLWHAQPIFFAIMLTWFCLHMGLLGLFMRRGHQLAEVHAESQSELSGKIIDTLTNMLNVRLFARRDYENVYIQSYQTEEIKKARAAIFHVELMRIFQGWAGLFLIFAMQFTLIYGWRHGWVTLGDFTLVTLLSFSMLGMLWFVSFQITAFLRETGKVQAALQLIAHPHDIQDAPNASTLHVTQGTVEFRDVNFHYPQQHNLFKNFSVAIPAGQKVGLVGLSGSGKSTFVNLILRFYDVLDGGIYIDQQKITTVTRDSLREHIAMIPQDPSLFHRTLMENIRYARLDASDADVIEAAKKAHCHDFIQELDAGYDTSVGERGIKLSGGQRQRIAIARAILKQAPILILDEATSSLDSVTEKIIHRSLQQLMQSCTTIVVAHRLSTLADMDRILVFDNGRIVEDGSQDELLALNGHFKQLWEQQYQGFLPD